MSLMLSFKNLKPVREIGRLSSQSRWNIPHCQKLQCEFNTFHLSDLKVGIM